MLVIRGIQRIGNAVRISFLSAQLNYLSMPGKVNRCSTLLRVCIGIVPFFMMFFKEKACGAGATC